MHQFKQEHSIDEDIEIVPSTRFRKEIYKTYPESRFDAQYRALKLHETMVEKLWRAGCYEKRGLMEEDEDEKGESSKSEKYRNVCYIVVSHGMFVDNLATVMDSLYDPGVFGEPGKFSNEQLE